ncbi:hypothetical protein [Kiloniella antarctica]|uniref:Uncharacterized protein n=1 Tax=Kiloniella antarctica TaxID=1550907 RepID=A0ABW5BLM5_9PROT
MFKTLTLGLVLSSFSAFTGLVSAPVYAATTNKEACIVIGGVGMPNFVPQEDGTITIIAPLTGSVSSAAGKVTGQRETETGLEMDMEHYFMTEDGGFMHTKDLGILTNVVGKQGQYMIEITYHVQEASTSGSLKDYKGNFSSYGLVDLPKLQGLIRYSGKVCK